MGALDKLQEFVKSKFKKTKDKNLTNPKNSATPGTGDTTHGEYGGFPKVNYAAERISIRPVMVPRQKYTYGVQFNINEDALADSASITNINKFITNSYLYMQLKRIDHPKPAFSMLTLRSYNKYVKIPTKMEFPPASMTFDDDTMSITTALIKEYINFYSHSGDVGSQLLAANNVSDSGPVHPPNFNSSFADTAFSSDQPNVGYNHLIANSATDQPRANMNTRPSMGMRLKTNYKRHFFNSIVIYDLGTDPNSINIYYFYRPVITTIDHAGLDIEDRTSKVEITMNFEYENYYFAIGRNKIEVADAIESLTGIRPPESLTNNFFPNNHGSMESIPNNTVFPVDKASSNPMTTLPDTDTPAPPLAYVPSELRDPYGKPKPVRPTGEIQSEIDVVKKELVALQAKSESIGGEDFETDFDIMRLKGKLDKLNVELDDTSSQVAAAQKIERESPATKSATENTRNKAIDETLSRSEALIKEIQDSDGLTDEQKKNLIAQVTEENVSQIRSISNSIRGRSSIKNYENRFQGPPEREIPDFERNVDSRGNIRGLTKEQWAKNEAKSKAVFDKASAKSKELTKLINDKESGIVRQENKFFGGDQTAARVSLEALADERRRQRAIASIASDKFSTAIIAQEQITDWENSKLNGNEV